MTINSESYFYVSDGYLFVSGEMTRKNTFSQHSIDVISNGMTNSHFFVYTKNNILYGFGWNTGNRLGILSKNLSNKDSYIPLEIKYTFDSRIKQISCGLDHSLFLTQMGTVYGCGSNENGQLSQNYDLSLKSSDVIRPMYKNIKYIGCNASSSYLLDNDNRFISFGVNFYNQLGIALHGSQLNMFDCGANFIGCLSIKNELIMFGFNDYCQCGGWGIVPKSGNNVCIKNDIIVDVKCGGSHTIVKTQKDVYYGFGSNEDKKLLMDSNNNERIKVPTIINRKYIKQIIKIDPLIIIDIIPAYHDTFIIHLE